MIELFLLLKLREYGPIRITFPDLSRWTELNRRNPLHWPRALWRVCRTQLSRKNMAIVRGHRSCGDPFPEDRIQNIP